MHILHSANLQHSARMTEGERTVPSIPCQEKQIQNWILISHKSEKQLKTAKTLNPGHESAKLLEENPEDKHRDVDVGNEVWTPSISRDRQITNRLVGFINLKKKGKLWKEGWKEPLGKEGNPERRCCWRECSHASVMWGWQGLPGPMMVNDDRVCKNNLLKLSSLSVSYRLRSLPSGDLLLRLANPATYFSCIQ